MPTQKPSLSGQTSHIPRKRPNHELRTTSPVVEPKVLDLPKIANLDYLGNMVSMWKSYATKADFEEIESLHRVLAANPQWTLTEEQTRTLLRFNAARMKDLKDALTLIAYLETLAKLSLEVVTGVVKDPSKAPEAGKWLDTLYKNNKEQL